MIRWMKERLPVSDLAVIGLILAGCAVASFYWIGPNLERARGRDTAAALYEQREQLHRVARVQSIGVRRSIHELQERVREQGGGMPPVSAINQRIAGLTAVAQRNAVTIEEVEPGPTLSAGEHLDTQIHLRARGTYVAFRRFLHGVEQELPFVDVTHFSIAAASGTSSAECRVSWVVHMYSRAPGAAPQESRGQNPQSQSAQRRSS